MEFDRKGIACHEILLPLKLKDITILTLFYLTWTDPLRCHSKFWYSIHMVNQDQTDRLSSLPYIQTKKRKRLASDGWESCYTACHITYILLSIIRISCYSNHAKWEKHFSFLMKFSRAISLRIIEI